MVLLLEEMIMDGQILNVEEEEDKLTHLLHPSMEDHRLAIMVNNNMLLVHQCRLLLFLLLRLEVVVDQVL